MSLQGIHAKLGNVYRMIDEGTVDAGVLNAMPGFTPISYQGEVESTSEIQVYAHPDYKNKQYLEFVVKPLPRAGFNPSLMTITLPIRFIDSDGTELTKTTSPVNGWLGSLIETVEVFRDGSNQLITPAKKTRVSDRYISRLQYTAAYQLKQYDYQYLSIQVTHATRENNTDTAGDRTNKLIESRVAAFYDEQKVNTYYTIPLGALHNFFDINDVIQSPVKIRLTLETNMNKIFDITEKRADNVKLNPHGDFTYFEAPYLSVIMMTMSPFYIQTFNKLLSTRQSYRLGNVTDDIDVKTAEMTNGKKSYLFDFQNTNKQFDYFVISLKPRASIDHATPYDNYGVERATQDISEIRFQGVNIADQAKNPSYDLTKEDIRKQLHQTYVSYISGVNCSVANLNILTAGDVRNLFPTQKKYFSSGHYLVFHMSASKGYTGKPDPIKRNDNDITINVILKKPIDKETMVLEVFMISKSEYGLVRGKSGDKLVYADYTATSLL